MAPDPNIVKTGSGVRGNGGEKSLVSKLLNKWAVLAFIVVFGGIGSYFVFFSSADSMTTLYYLTKDGGPYFTTSSAQVANVERSGWQLADQVNYIVPAKSVGVYNLQDNTTKVHYYVTEDDMTALSSDFMSKVHNWGIAFRVSELGSAPVSGSCRIAWHDFNLDKPCSTNPAPKASTTAPAPKPAPAPNPAPAPTAKAEQIVAYNGQNDGCGGNATHYASSANKTHVGQSSYGSSSVCVCNSGRIIAYGAAYQWSTPNPGCNVATSAAPTTNPTQTKAFCEANGGTWSSNGCSHMRVGSPSIDRIVAESGTANKQNSNSQSFTSANTQYVGYAQSGSINFKPVLSSKTKALFR